MSVSVKRLVIKRFRSFPADMVEFENPLFIVGRNGAGKSNFADIFAFMSDCMSLQLQAAFDKRGGIAAVRNMTSGRSYPPNLGLGFEFGPINGNMAGGRFAFEVRALPGYGFEVVREQCLTRHADGNRFWYDRKRVFETNVQGLKPALDPTALCLPIVGGDDRFAPALRLFSGMRRYAIEPARLRDMQDPDQGASLKSDGSNAASVLQEIVRKKGGRIDDVCEFLATIVPNTRSVQPKKHGNKLTMEFAQTWGNKGKLKLEAFSMSDGTLRAVGLLMAVFQRPAPSILVVEEPEATIHPGALGAILDLLRDASSRVQVVVTTHSPELLDADWVNDDCLRVANWSEGASVVRPLASSSRQALRKHLMGAGELLRSNALLPEPLFKEDEALRNGDLFEEVA
ncbi:MAG: AAA family ATPase [Elusimicrobia bacterium]|nr:AAA family ATPase [Elusimicrobiota bacterium]